MNNCFHFTFNQRSIIIYGSQRIDTFYPFQLKEAGAYTVEDCQETSAQACYLEMRENGKKLWSRRFSTDIIETAACVCVYEPTFRRIILGYGLKVYALEETTGKIKWSARLDTPVHAVLQDEMKTIFVQHELGILKLNMEGKIEWEYSHDDVILQTTMETRQLWILDITGAKYSIDLDSGKLLLPPKKQLAD